MPPQQTPAGSPTTAAPVQQGTHWTVVLGGIVALALIAGGAYYFFFVQGGQLPAPQTQQAQNVSPTEDNDIDAIEADLNASGNADSSADLDSLEESL